MTAYRSTDGTTSSSIGSATVSMGSTVYVGLAVTSNDVLRTATARLANVIAGTTSAPPPPTNHPPTVSLTAPTNYATYTAPASIPLAATASDVDRPVRRVDFYAGSTLLGSDWTPPFAYTWSAAAAGSYGITAVARDNSGGATTSAVRTVTVSGGWADHPPTVSLTAPTNGATYIAPASIPLAATASDVDGPVGRVASTPEAHFLAVIGPAVRLHLERGGGRVLRHHRRRRGTTAEARPRRLSGR